MSNDCAVKIRQFVEEMADIYAPLRLSTVAMFDWGQQVGATWFDEAGRWRCACRVPFVDDSEEGVKAMAHDLAILAADRRDRRPTMTLDPVTRRQDREFVLGGEFRHLLRFAHHEGLLSELLLEEGIPLRRPTEEGVSEGRDARA